MGRGLLALSVTAILGIWGCSSSPELAVRQEMAVAQRLREWSHVYFQSYQREGNPHYLRLSRESLQKAIRSYFDLQVRIGHDYPDFYTIDRLRRTSCDLLNQLDREALRGRVEDWENQREGCLK